METKTTYFPTLRSIREASETLKGLAIRTPLMKNYTYSKQFGSNVFLKREDLQQVRSYKIRGAYNKIHSLNREQRRKGIVCASAGNHAQGVAFACAQLKISGTIFMPTPIPKQKLEQVKMFGGTYIDVVLEGDTFDDANDAATKMCSETGAVFVHPFDSEKIIEGQATVGLEIIEQAEVPLDYVFVPIGGGGLAAGLSSIFQVLSPKTKIVGVEPEGAPAMKKSIEQKKRITLEKIDKFVDGAAVKRVGSRNFEICKELMHEVITVPEGKVCQTILSLYNKEAIVVEPAGALTLTALDFYAQEIKGKNIACIISGSNNDITRTAEIKERALLYNGLKHYFIIRFPQRAGALKEFVADILGPSDDITYFQYTKRTSREAGPAVVGIEIEKSSDLELLIERMKAFNFYGDYLNDKPDLFQFLV